MAVSPKLTPHNRYHLGLREVASVHFGVGQFGGLNRCPDSIQPNL